MYTHSHTTLRENDEKSCLSSLRSDAMNSMISTLQQAEHSTSVFYLLLLFHLSRQSNSDRWTEPNTERLNQTRWQDQKDKLVGDRPAYGWWDIKLMEHFDSSKIQIKGHLNTWFISNTFWNAVFLFCLNGCSSLREVYRRICEKLCHVVLR